MARSKWKGPHVNPTLLIQMKKESRQDEIKTMSRSSEILPSFVGKNFNVHMGKTYTTLLITEEMVGHKLGEFAFTRRYYIFKKNKK